jgi:hypothetical protein
MSTISEILSRTRSENIDDRLKYALSTGTWGKRKDIHNMLQRCSILQRIASLRRIDTTHKTTPFNNDVDDMPPLEDIPFNNDVDDMPPSEDMPD